jgi:hypothetical protein
MDTEIMDEIANKYGEWLETSEQPGLLLLQIMSTMIKKERENASYYKKLANAKMGV